MDLKSLVPIPMTRRQRRALIKSACITAVIIAALLVLVVSYAMAATAGFPDVPQSNPYHTAIGDLAGKGVINGYTNGTFGPDGSIMRQQFAKMIVLAGGYPVSENDVCPFGDVAVSGPGNLYPDNYVAVAAANHLTVGKTPTTFDPYASVTRYQVVTMVVRMLANLQPDLLVMPPSGWKGSAGWETDPLHGPNAEVAEYNGLLAGLDLAALNPYGNMTRGEAAQVLYNAMAKLATTTTTTSIPGSSSTIALSTTSTAHTTTTIALTTTTAPVPITTTTTTLAPIPVLTNSVAGLESASFTVHVPDQFGNPMPGEPVVLTSTKLEGQLSSLMTSKFIGYTDEHGNAAWTWTQNVGDWGVEEVVATVDGLPVYQALVQWALDDIPTDHVAAVAGQAKVTVAPGYGLWNGDTLTVRFVPLGASLGSGVYVSSAGITIGVSHVWVSTEAYFVGAASTNTDGEPNWMYNIVP